MKTIYKSFTIIAIIIIVTIKCYSQQCTTCSGTTVTGITPSAIGTNTKATANYSFAAGYGSEATQQTAIALGHFAKANGIRSISIGENCVSNSQGYSFGQNAKALGFIVENLGVNNSNTAISLKITTQIGYGSIVQPGSQSTTAGDWGFTEDDQHWWQRNSYNCFNYNPEDTRGAPEVIEGTLMFGYIPAPPPNCRYVYPQIFTYPLDPINYPADQNNDNFCDYKIFYAKGTYSQIMTDQIQCLGLEAAHPGIHEMAFYTTGLKEIIDGFLALPANQNFKCQKVYIDSPPAAQINSNLWYIQHSPSLYYGVRQTICNQPAFNITTYVD